ncbi:hypothetical protein [Herbaspirillum sp. 1130]|uniref:hypothetical protein n=1 Tax=Herbaspirillum sp. 1130 TaxID=2806562 RepID=UPI001AE6318E|nr:hypothetical protein [Herbaspirillum sp. 1130]MBP1314418.1 hypothetical protein [Herbaspirillum sp. 1130]
MTAVMIWLNKESLPHFEDIWAVADTQVSKGENPLTKQAPKIFSIPVNCYWPGESGFFDTVGFAGSVGVAFAGSTLIAHSAVLAVTPLFANLISTSKAVPTLEGLALYFLDFLKQYFLSTNAITMPNDRATVEFCFFGRCPRSGELGAFRGISDVSSAEIGCDPVQFDEQETVIHLGSHKAEIAQMVNDERARHPIGSLPWWRSPYPVMRRIVAAELFSDIGGTTLLAITSGSRVQTYTRPWVPGAGHAHFSYLGTNVEVEFDDCRVGLPSLY